jgi:hypothetical protein
METRKLPKMCPKVYHMILEGPTTCADDDVHYTFIATEELIGSKVPLLIPQASLDKLIGFCNSDEKDNYYCYDDVKRVDADGKDVAHQNLALISSVGLYGEVFSAILKKVGDKWQVIAVETTQFVQSSEFTKLSKEKKNQKILDMIQSYVTNPKDYSTIHVVLPYKEGRKYPFG